MEKNDELDKMKGLDEIDEIDKIDLDGELELNWNEEEMESQSNDKEQEEPEEPLIVDDFFNDFLQSGDIESNREILNGIESKEDVDEMFDIEHLKETQSEDEELWHEYDSEIFKHPEDEIKNAIDYTKEDFNTLDFPILIIEGITEAYEVQACKELTELESNKQRGALTFMRHTNGDLIQIGRLEICIETFINLLDIWKYNIYILTKEENEVKQRLVNEDVLNLLLI